MRGPVGWNPPLRVRSGSLRVPAVISADVSVVPTAPDADPVETSIDPPQPLPARGAAAGAAADTAWAGSPTGSGTSVPPDAAEASTTTARFTSTPRCRPSASLIGRRRIRSMASLANSLGAASRAVPSISPRGRVSRRKARCWEESVEAPEFADAPDRSAMTRFHT